MPLVVAQGGGDPVDVARVERVQAAIRVAIDQVRLQASSRRQRAQVMRASWKGPYADQFFGNELPRMERQADQLVAELQRWWAVLASAE
jgi:hypothetical protein